MHYAESLERGNSGHGGEVQTRTRKTIKWLQAKTLPTDDQNKVAERNKKKVGDCRAQPAVLNTSQRCMGLVSAKVHKEPPI